MFKLRKIIIINEFSMTTGEKSGKNAHSRDDSWTEVEKSIYPLIGRRVQVTIGSKLLTRSRS